MGLFGKKNNEAKPCGFGGACAPAAEEPSSQVKVLGGGCAKCQALEEATVAALAELGMDDAVEHVRDFGKIAGFGVMTTPALVVDGQVVSQGTVLKKDQVVEAIRKVRG